MKNIRVLTEKQGSPGIEVLAWKTWHSSSLPCHPLPKKTSIKNCFWHHSIGLSLFLPTPHSNGAVESRLCETLGGKRGISTYYWQLFFPKAIQKSKGICPCTHVQDTTNLCTRSQSNFAAKHEHQDALTILHHHGMSWGNRGRGLGYQWIEPRTLAQLTFGMSKSWVQRSPKWMS